MGKMRVQFFYRLIWVYVSVIFQFRFPPLAYYSYFDGIYHFVHARCYSVLPKKKFQCAMQDISRIGITGLAELSPSTNSFLLKSEHQWLFQFHRIRSLFHIMWVETGGLTLEK